ncbi:ribonuclease H-like domain-containing protein [Tanacetum coccineum]
MVTPFRVGTNRLTERLNLHASSVSPLPKSYRDAFNDSNWQNAMRNEYTTLIKNKTWTLVPRPSDTNIVRCMWLFCHKYLADGTLSRYKARLVENGSTQLEGVDVDETSSSVVKLGTIRTVLSLATSRHWPIHQLDVKNAFIIRSLHQEFAITDLCPLNYFHGISVTHDSLRLFLSQKKYAIDILDRPHMNNCNPSQTPIDTDSKLGSDGDPVSDPTLYRSLADLVAYLDANWAGCPTNRRSTSGYCVFLGNNLLSWSSKHQPTLSRSSVEVEYRGVVNVVAETCWLRNLLRELHTPLSSATLVNYDNGSAIYLSCNLGQHQHTKHIDIDMHFICDLVAAG